MTAAPVPRFTIGRDSRQLTLRVGGEAYSLGVYPSDADGRVALWQRIFALGVDVGRKEIAAPRSEFYDRDGANIVRHDGASISTAANPHIAALIVRLLNDFAEKWPTEEREHVA
jgi:hypothetical protein